MSVGACKGRRPGWVSVVDGDGRQTGMLRIFVKVFPLFAPSSPLFFEDSFFKRELIRQESTILQNLRAELDGGFEKDNFSLKFKGF